MEEKNENEQKFKFSGCVAIQMRLIVKKANLLKMRKTQDIKWANIFFFKYIFGHFDLPFFSSSCFLFLW